MNESPLRPPPAASAVADILLAASRRAFTLHARLVEDLVGLAATPPAARALPAWPGPPAAGPMLRWALGVATVGQQATASIVTVIAAQARGAAAQVDAIARAPRAPAAPAAGPAADAAQEVVGHGLATVGRAGEAVLRTGVAASDAAIGAGVAATRVAPARPAAPTGAGRTPARRGRDRPGATRGTRPVNRSSRRTP